MDKLQSTYNQVGAGEVDEEEYHPVLVVQLEPLSEEVDQGVEVGHEADHQLEAVDRDGDHIGRGEPGPDTVTAGTLLAGVGAQCRNLARLSMSLVNSIGNP